MKSIKQNWQWYIVIVIANMICLWVMACPPQTTSLSDSHTEVTREELQLELETIISTAKIRMADLNKQDELRQIILQNGVLIIESVSVNPL